MSMRRGRTEGGYTLTEVLVAVVILAVCIVAVVGAMGSAIFSSRLHRDLVTGDAAVRAYSEQILQASYVNCATPAQYPAPTPTPPGGLTVSITSITYWNGSGSGQNFGPTCSTDHGAQRITFKAQRANGAGKQTLAIVKRAP